jgi:large subunit ribosomal protein L4
MRVSLRIYANQYANSYSQINQHIIRIIIRVVNMTKVTVYNLTGKKVEDLELSDAVFGAKENDALLHQVYVAQYANQRKVLAHTKDISERAGSGRKPWAQKGTGRARTGTVRNPIWRKGGVIFGPTKDRNFSKKTNKKMRQKGVIIALSEKVRAKNLVVVDEIKLKDKKTKEFAKALKNLKIKGNVLIGFAGSEKDWQLYSRNVNKADNILTSNLNVFDLLNHKYLMLSKESVKFLEEKFK